MSSAEMPAFPAVAALAAAATCATPAGAAVLAVQAAGRAAERAVAVVGGRGAPGAGRSAGPPDWPAIAADMVELNARIRLLNDRADRAGVSVAVPGRVGLVGRDTTDAALLCARAAVELRSALERLHAAVAVAEWNLAIGRLSSDLGARPDTAAALARCQRVLMDRHTASTGSREDSAAADLGLRMLDEDADESERLEVLCAAVCADRAAGSRAGTALRESRARIAAVNEAVAGRRLCAQWLSALEEPFVRSVELPVLLPGIPARLRAVLAGEEVLTARLRAEAVDGVAWAAEVARRRFVRELACSRLVERGYHVSDQSAERHRFEVRLARAEWRGELSAEVWLDQREVLHGCLMRDDGAPDGVTDRDGFRTDLADLGRLINAAVVVEDGCVAGRLLPWQTGGRP